jgi:hypothetical protein
MINRTTNTSGRHEGATVARMAAVLVLTMTFMAMLGSPAVTVATADSMLLADFEVSSLALAPNGALKVGGSYVCPSGYATRARYDALASVFQRVPSGGFDGFRFFGLRILCDGMRNEVAVRIPEAGTEGAFSPDLPLVISLSLFASGDEEDSVSAYDRETLTVQTLLADIGIGSVEFIEDGAVRVTGHYVCPDGYNVDSTFARVSQPIGPGTLKIRHFDRRVVCNGAPHDLAVRFHETRSGEPFVPDVANAVQLSFDATSSNAELLVQAIDQRTLIVQE